LGIILHAQVALDSIFLDFYRNFFCAEVAKGCDEYEVVMAEFKRTGIVVAVEKLLSYC
jgi:hypothetical protein